MEELSGCWTEAHRCDRVANELLRIRTTLGIEFHDQVSGLLNEVEMTSRLLRDLYDLFSIYGSRIPVILYYLTVVLPCIQKTTRDMLIYVDHDSLPALSQWNLLNERLGDQGGMDLVARFVM